MLDFPDELVSLAHALPRGVIKGKVPALAFKGRMDHEVREVREFGTGDGVGDAIGVVWWRVKMFMVVRP